MILFVDFHGTLSNMPYWHDAPKDMLDFIQSFLFTDNVTIVEQWMRGEMSAVEICDFLSWHSCYTSSEIYDFLQQSCTTFQLNHAIFRALKATRHANYTLVLVTANMDCFHLVAKHLQLQRYFDLIVNTYDHGILKHDNSGYLFSSCLQTLNGTFSDSIFIDDSEEICDLFASKGGTAHIVSGPEAVPGILRQPRQLDLFGGYRLG